MSNTNLSAENPFFAHSLSNRSPLWEWTARIHSNKHELGSGFSVNLFLGEPPKDPKDWLTASNFAGVHHVDTSGGGKYGGHRPAGEDVYEGFVELNPAIVRFSNTDTLDPEVIEPYLTDNLQWRVQNPDGTSATISSLEIVIFAMPLTYPPREMFPVPGERRRYNSITNGKEGGNRN